MRKPSMFKHWQNDARGVTAVEFALVSPLLFAMIFGIIEISMIMFAQNVMENATFVASRTGKTGYVAEGSTREEMIRTAVETQAGILMDTEQLDITTETYPEYGDIGSPEPFVDANANGERDDGENFTDMNGNGVYDTDMGTPSAGAAGDIVVYTVTYPWHLFGPTIGQFFGSLQTIELTAKAIIKNEPYE